MKEKSKKNINKSVYVQKIQQTSTNSGFGDLLSRFAINGKEKQKSNTLENLANLHEQLISK